MSFPLYSHLDRKIKISRDLKASEKSELIKNITDTKDVHEIIYALIKMYHQDKDNGDELTIPYNGDYGKNYVTYDLQKLPVKLRRFLHEFMILHKKKLEEDMEIQSSVPETEKQ